MAMRTTPEATLRRVSEPAVGTVAAADLRGAISGSASAPRPTMGGCLELPRTIRQAGSPLRFRRLHTRHAVSCGRRSGAAVGVEVAV
jgi:hypothetical protein